MGVGGATQTSDISEVAGVRFLGRVIAGVDPRDLKSLADEGKKAVGSGVVALVAVSGDGKGAVVVAVTDDLTKRFNAVELVRAGSEALGGKGGGGRPDMAQAGGPKGANADAAVAAVKSALASA
jgi:alanyl-tRNA synthetase